MGKDAKIIIIPGTGMQNPNKQCCSHRQPVEFDEINSNNLTSISFSWWFWLLYIIDGTWTEQCVLMEICILTELLKENLNIGKNVLVEVTVKIPVNC